MAPGIPPLRRYTRDSRTSASDQNRLRETVEQLSRASVAEGTGFAGGTAGGVPVLSPSQPPDFWIRIDGPLTGAPAGYHAWTEMIPEGGTGYFLAPGDGMAGSAGFPAFEHRGAAVEIGTIAPAWLSGTDPVHAVFLAPAASILPRCRQIPSIQGPPPWVPPPEVCCNEEYFDGIYRGIWNCGTGKFVYYCPCEPFDGPGSGSGSGTGCVPGTCSICTDAPFEWELPVSGFTGDCAVFNRDWTLAYADSCVWAEGVLINGVNVTCRLALASTGHTLDFAAYSDAGVLASASYTAAATALPDCCAPLTFASAACSCDAPNAPLPCSGCTVTPSVWSATLAGFTGCYSRFNGAWTLTPDLEACRWRYEGAPNEFIEMILEVQANGSVLLMLGDYLPRVGGRAASIAQYVSGVVAPDCCSPVTAARTFDECETAGEVPATVLLSPQCAGTGGAGSCPAALTATPVCCTDLPPDEPECACEECPGGAPPRWLVTVFGAAGDMAAANGDWALAHDTGCLWTQTRGDIAGTLQFYAGKGWRLSFINGITQSLSEYTAAPFNCCGRNAFAYHGPHPPGRAGYIADNELTITPDGPCAPCPGGPGGPESPCCPGITLPDLLYATPSGSTGACADFDALPSAGLARVPGTDIWAGTYKAPNDPDPDHFQNLQFQCATAGWTLTSSGGGGYNCGWIGVRNAAESSCSPLVQTFDVANMGCCAGGVRWTVTP